MKAHPTHRSYVSKRDAREALWDYLSVSGLGRPPMPLRGRIPNYVGAEQAASRLLDHPLVAAATTIKANPDTAQQPFRAAALAQGKRLLMPTPKLRGGFWLIDPSKLNASERIAASHAAHVPRVAQAIALEDLPRPDLIVVGAVAVTRSGRRCGKGKGYGDLEYGILRALGHPHVPIVTTVHAAQVVNELPRDSHDVPLALIATPHALLETHAGDPPPVGIDWTQLTPADIEAMPVLRSLAPKHLRSMA